MKVLEGSAGLMDQSIHEFVCSTARQHGENSQLHVYKELTVAINKASHPS